MRVTIVGYIHIQDKFTVVHYIYDSTAKNVVGNLTANTIINGIQIFDLGNQYIAEFQPYKDTYKIIGFKGVD